MFWVWIEDLIEIGEQIFIWHNRITRELQYQACGNPFCHSDKYMHFAYYLTRKE